MAVSDNLEDLSSLIPALHLLQKLGYRYLPPSEARALRGGKTSRVVLEAVLTEQLRRLNRVTFKGREYPFSELNIQRAVQAVTQIPFDSLVHTNEKVYDLLTLGKSLEQTVEGHTKSFSVKYIDWANPANNVFHICDEFEVERRHSRKTRRLDIVLFVNGLPLAVIECKRPDLKDAVEQGIGQHLRNQRTDEIPDLFVYSQLLLSVSQNRAMYGTAGTPLKFWSVWKEEDEKAQETELRRLINEPLTEEQNARLFLERDERQLDYMQRFWRSGGRLPSAQDKAIHSLLRPARLLELAYQFIVFDDKEKKVCRCQQYFAVKATMERVIRLDGDGRRQGGVIWHTTGSGKSLTMLMLAKALALEPSIRNPKVVLVTDRVDLDDQIYRTFKACGKSVVQATSGENLLDLISHGKATIITTIIDKFETASRKHKVRDESRDIFVLVDESHRSQYGVAHAKMRGVFPNACYIGFTGTPLLRKEKSTAQKFGGFIHKYTMNQAVRDGAVAPLLYEGRMSELHGDREQIDKWFDRITEGLTPEQKAGLKKRFRREEALTRVEGRIARIAYDIGRHFKDNFKGTGKKGQLAVSGKAAALRYKRCFEQFGDVSVDVVISAPDTREEHESTDESAVPEVQRFWKAMMAKYGNEKRYTESVVNAFKHSDEPEIIIVVDKLLTGFDAPRNSVLYIDKRLKEHNILQAIARVNRLYEGKDYGLVIDYRGIFGELNEAIDTYAALENEGFDREDVEGTLTDVAEEIKRLHERHTNVWEVFKYVRNKKDIEAMQRHLEPEERRLRFYEMLSLYARTLQLALANPKFQDETPETKKQRFTDDLKYFLNLCAAVKQRFGESVDYSVYDAQIRGMVNKYIGADAVKEIVCPVDLFAVEQLEHELGRVEGDAARADVIASRMKITITERMEEDPALYRRLSEMIEEAIAGHRARRLSDAEYLTRIRRHLDELRGMGAAALPGQLMGCTDAGAYYRLVKEPMGRYQVSGIQPEDLAADIAVHLEQIINSHKIRDWIYSVDVQNQMLNDMEDYLFSVKGQYGIDLTYDEIDSLLQQVLAVAKRRDPRA